jgi:hypothetical protein
MLLTPAGSASASASSSASWTSALKRHGDHLGSATLLVIRVLALMAAAAAVVTVLLLLVQGDCCSCEITACVVIGGSVIASDGDHVIQRQLICIDQAS